MLEPDPAGGLSILVGVLILGLGLLRFARTTGGTVRGGGDTVSR